MTTRPFPAGPVPLAPPAGLRRRYSVTSDVLGFRRCSRQYGAFRVYQFAPAQQTQLFYGTIVHQVLDRAHAHYHGVPDPRTKGNLPSDTDVDKYFDEVEQGLRSRGVCAGSRGERDRALRVVKYFNLLEGPALYPRVVDTEHRLQADNGTHVLFGVVDLLVNSAGTASTAASCEIWDYKGSSRLHMTKRELESYEFQMRVYAHLYEQRHGVRPAKAILYFMNELDGAKPPSSRPANAVLEVTLSRIDITRAVSEFTKTVHDIEQARLADAWPAATPHDISAQTCAVCDLRWDCTTASQNGCGALRYP
jgi:hypothetical protein